MSDDNAPYLLVSWVKDFASLIAEICRLHLKKLPKDILCVAGQIAARLQAICEYIKRLPHYAIEPNLYPLCRTMLKHLATISLWPQKIYILPGLVVSDCNRLMAERDRFSRKESIFLYFSKAGNESMIDGFFQDCCDLFERLSPTDAEDATSRPMALQNISHRDHSKHSQELFNTLQKHCRCSSCLNEIPGESSASHPTRLYLEGDEAIPSYGIVVSSMKMTYWQELRLNMPSTESYNGKEELEMVKHGQFCDFVNEPLFSRVLFEFKPGYGLYQHPLSEPPVLTPAPGEGQSLSAILESYFLSARDRVVLSYALARAYWQFYDSELTQTKWTSDTIWFMPTTNSASEDDEDQLPLQAFVSFPFAESTSVVQDYISDLKLPLNHRSPRVFALGVLLLEIGLGKQFPTRILDNPSSQINFDHITATNMLETLRKTKWGGFSHMPYFIDAVEYCVNGANFIRDDKNTEITQNRQRRRELKGIAKRRKDIYNKVVKPLAWLATKGFSNNSKDITYITKTDNASQPATQKEPPPKLIPEQKFQDASFHSLQSSNWLQNLKGISASIDRIWGKQSGTKPIQVAILDTGIKPDMPFYQDEDYGDDRMSQIESFEDFVDPGSSRMVDDYGHGSLMARIVAESTPFAFAPFVKIMVARVARNMRDLPQSQGNISKAIHWAGENGADIICMSFGFPREDAGINQAIKEITSEKKNITILASAGNSPDEEEAFPARHPNVISIYATNRHGKFLDFNARRPSDGSHIFGTFGDSLPPEITAEFEREYRGVCQPGSSVATAAAASMAAIMLAYISVLPKVPSPPSDSLLQVLQRARQSKGMIALFRQLAVEMSDNRYSLNLSPFWRKKNTHEARYNAMSTWLWDIHQSM